jgi:hypothetical protein
MWEGWMGLRRLRYCWRSCWRCGRSRIRGRYCVWSLSCLCEKTKTGEVAMGIALDWDERKQD